MPEMGLTECRNAIRSFFTRIVKLHVSREDSDRLQTTRFLYKDFHAFDRITYYGVIGSFFIVLCE